MPWQRRIFKGNKVFVRVDESGSPLEKDGRVEIRYKLTDPRAYQAAAANLRPLGPGEGDKTWGDEEAVAAVAPPDTRATSAAAGATGHGATAGAGEAGAEGSAAAADPARAAAVAGSNAPSRAAKPPSKINARTSTTSMVRGGGHSVNPPFFNDREPIVIYTDGACSGNPGPAGIGAVLICGEKRRELSEFLGQATNNIAELTAIKRALEEVRDPQRTVLLHVDSEYTMGVLNGWKVKANQDLVAQIKAEMARFPDLRFIKVAGHAGVPENERCDELARGAIARGR